MFRIGRESKAIQWSSAWQLFLKEIVFGIIYVKKQNIGQGRILIILHFTMSITFCN